MRIDTNDIERHVDATAALIGLPIGAQVRAGVLHYFGIAAGMAKLVMQHPLSPEDEPAPVFTPVSPPAGQAQPE